MASQPPVIFMGGGEGDEIVREHDAGKVVAPGDLDGLVVAIRELADGGARVEEIARNARRAAESRFDRAKIASRFISVLEAGLDENSPLERAA